MGFQTFERPNHLHYGIAFFTFTHGMQVVKRRIYREPGPPRPKRAKRTGFALYGAAGRGRNYIAKVGPSLALGVPKTLRTKLVYGEDFADTTAGGFSYIVYRANDCYDPNLTGVGGQPTYFDQLITLYRRFCVVGCKCVVEAYNGDAVPTDIGVYGLPDSTAQASGWSNALLGHPNFVTKRMTPTGTSGDRCMVTITRTTARMLGCKDVMDDTEYKGHAGGSPGRPWYWHVLWQNTDAGAAAVELKVTLTMDVVFTEPAPTLDV